MVARPPAWRLRPWNKKFAAALIGATSGTLAALSHCQTLPVAGNLGGGNGGGGLPPSPPPEDCSDTEMHGLVILKYLPSSKLALNILLVNNSFEQ